ncbi:S41 family peptidase [Pseudonocardia acaciae]|uniref:S41 family peptidase n=1 Tax=Pseudonocardia acaciae TaxID=551276 RepID=UPI000491955E|nr:S41 family peptidase [Pseudonocardia acaciae]
MASGSPTYLRFPHLRGSSLVFVAENDVWLAPVDGGRAYRLSADQEPVRNPRLSDDGARVAWTSRRDGAPEVLVADTEGGLATRLTYWGDPKTLTLGWTDQDEVVAITATGQPSSRRTWAHAVPTDGGPPRVLPYGPVANLAGGPTGTVLLSAVMSREPAWWKRYRGGTAGKLWWRPSGGDEFARLLPELNGNIESPMLVGDRIAFLSDHEGWGNVYSVAVDGTDLRRHTDHGAEGGSAAEPADASERWPFYARHATSDGTTVVYESGGQLWLLDGLDAPARRLDVRLGGPRTARARYQISAARHLSTAVPDKTGRLSVVGVRGTVHRLTHRDGPARTLASEPGVRHRLARPLGEDWAVWITDVDGEDALAGGPLTDGDSHSDGEEQPEPARYGAGEIGRVLELACAPDGSRVALACHDGRLLVFDVAAERFTELARGADGEVTGLAFSPDSAWLAWSDPVEQGMRRILIAKVTDDSPVPVAVTPTRFVDTSPVFTTDGKHLAFLSYRSFDPVYDAHSFDLSFPNGCRPFLVPLSARTPSPFGPSPDGRPPNGADDHDDKEKDDKDKAKDTEKDAEEKDAKDAAKDTEKDVDAPEVRVDPEGLPERVVALPVSEARYYRLRAGKDCLLWLRATPTGVLGDGLAEGAEGPRPVLERFDLVRRRHDRIADPADAFEVSGDGSRMVVRDRRALRVLRTDRQGSDKPGDDSSDEFDIDTGRISVTVDPTAEWRQMYDEAGRLMRDHFWVADMAGVDWAGELARYRPLVDGVGSHDDLVDLLWEVQGELGTSHAYVSPRGGYGSGELPGLLGADIERGEDGRWRVARVLPGESSDPRARSPLTAPGVDVRAGDVLLAVGGHPVDPTAGPAPLLVGTAGQPTELTIEPADAPGTRRRVVVLPLDDDEQLRYQDWVAGRRAFVADRSEGRLGYLHLPDMVANGWAQLHRDLGRETAREGLIVDVRYNGGGHLSQLVIEKLSRRVIGWDMIRHGQPTTYPLEAPRGPVVAVANEFAGSDGDIVTAAFQRVGIGPVVGERTWGGVIGIDSRYQLVDGTLVTQPRYAFWFDNLQWSVENGGVAPDVEVVMTPADHVADRDPQLAKAVDLALEALSERPAAIPPDPATRPTRSRPPLPPR